MHIEVFCSFNLFLSMTFLSKQKLIQRNGIPKKSGTKHPLLYCASFKSISLASYSIKFQFFNVCHLHFSQNQPILEAHTVFLLMKKGFPISRNVRAQWMLEHLDSVICIQPYSMELEELPELEIVSVLPKGDCPSWSVDTRHQFLYKVVSTTCIIFLAHKYRIVFSLDLSPSLATIVSYFVIVN